jgi:uncharacterized protein (DUF885 family)
LRRGTALRRAVASLALVATLAVPSRAQEIRALGDQRLDALANQYFDAVWKLDPIRATRIGVHDYDDKVGDYTAQGYEDRIALARRFRTDLEAIDPTSLGAESADDEAILGAALDEAILNLQTRELWRHDPSTYTTLASNAIFSLFSRNFAPAALRLHDAVLRERQLPALLAAGKANITTVDPVSAEISGRDIAGTIDFFTTVLPAAAASIGDAEGRAEFKTANDATLAALRDYQQFMEAGPFAHPSGTYAIGPKLFERMLALQELTPISLATYERVGEAALAQTKAEFIETAKKIDPAKSPQEVAVSLGADHPAADGLLREATADIVKLRAFVVAHQIVTLPAGSDNVKVVPTPEFARATTFASMNVPGPLETKATEAYYNVTPIEADWSAERKEQHLAFFNYYAFPIVTLHEVMPGHYVNFALDRDERLSLIRRVLSSPSFAEGWAHYDEQMMVDEGWGGGDPHVRLAQLQLALQRECRYLVGLREHTAGMSLDAATKFFEENAFMAEDTSRREALRGTQDPLYGYYTLGKLEILKLRADYEKKLGSKYSLELFHDQLLAHGDPPIAIARRTMLGVDDDGHLL